MSEPRGRAPGPAWRRIAHRLWRCYKGANSIPPRSVLVDSRCSLEVTMVRNRLLLAFTLLTLTANAAAAQSGQGSLRGYVRDEQGGVLPGVTVTATSPALLAAVVAVSDSAGYYRLNNLPPGTYVVAADLTGFAAYKREGILMRAGSTFNVDIQ